MRVHIINADDLIVSRGGPAELGENKIVPASPFHPVASGCSARANQGSCGSPI
jgi:hypothetical protein